MQYNFDEIIDRRESGALKYDGMAPYFGSNDLTPLWVADMDFRTPDFIFDAIKKRLDHPILGYTIKGQGFYSSIHDWILKKHGWNIENDWIVFSPGVVPACSISVLAFTEPGDKIIVQPPVYFPFYHVIEGNSRQLVYNPLILKDNKYLMDFDDLELKARDAKMLIISSPHNPGGRVWSNDELSQLAEIALKHNLLVLSDEIHSDLVFAPAKHIPLASLSEDISQQTISTFAPSKTFNLAGLSSSAVVIQNDDLRKKFMDQLAIIHIGQGNIFGTIALETAYRKGDAWLNQLLTYLQENLNFMHEFIKKHMPKIGVMIPEATYLVWLDFRPFNKSDDELNKAFLQAKLALSPGKMFGPGGEGFVRINIACPRKILSQALEQLLIAYNLLTK